VFQKCLSATMVWEEVPRFFGISAQTSTSPDVHSIISIETKVASPYLIPASQKSSQVYQEAPKTAPIRTLSPEDLVHVKLDQLMAQASFNGNSFGEALGEVERNIIDRHAKQMETLLESMRHSLTTMAEMVGNVQEELRFTKEENRNLLAEWKMFKSQDLPNLNTQLQDLQRHNRESKVRVAETHAIAHSLKSTLSTDISNLKANLIAALPKSSTTVWIVLGGAQILLCLLVLLAVTRRNKFDKLL